jgi:hypothetical protein
MGTDSQFCFLGRLEIGQVSSEATDIPKHAPSFGHGTVTRPVETHTKSIAGELLDRKKQHYEISRIDDTSRSYEHCVA